MNIIIYALAAIGAITVLRFLGSIIISFVALRFFVPWVKWYAKGTRNE